MVDVLVLELIEKHMVTNNISLFIGYSKDVHAPTGGSKKLKKYTSSYKEIMNEFSDLYHSKTAKDIPIRKISIVKTVIPFDEILDVNADFIKSFDEIPVFLVEELSHKKKQIHYMCESCFNEFKNKSSDVLKEYFEGDLAKILAV